MPKEFQELLVNNSDLKFSYCDSSVCSLEFTSTVLYESKNTYSLANILTKKVSLRFKKKLYVNEIYKRLRREALREAV